MMQKGLMASLVVLASAGGAKATTLGMKLFVMACAGLAGMYMVHLLAQDYNKYQSLSRVGRSVEAVERAAVAGGAEEGGDEGVRTRNDLLTLDRILAFDPTGCARRYVCTIAAKSPKKLTPPEKNIVHMLRSLPRGSRADSGHAAFMHALDLGRRSKDAGACAEEYPKCFLSISQMLKLLGWL